MDTIRKHVLSTNPVQNAAPEVYTNLGALVEQNKNLVQSAETKMVNIKRIVLFIVELLVQNVGYYMVNT